MQNVTWKPIVGWGGKDEVRDIGEVRSLNYKKTGKTKNLLLFKDNRGYVSVQLTHKGKTHKVWVHRLVATAFISNPDNYTVVNHKDENPSNNYVKNLEWCTVKYNVNYGTAMIRRRKTISLPVNQYMLDGTFVATYPSITDAANSTGIQKSWIATICRNRKGSAKGFTFSYIGENCHYHDTIKRPVWCISISDGTYTTFRSIREAAKISKAHPSNIIKAITGKIQQSAGCIWGYADNLGRENPINRNVLQIVVQ